MENLCVSIYISLHQILTCDATLNRINFYDSSCVDDKDDTTFDSGNALVI